MLMAIRRASLDDHHRAQPERADQLGILWQDVVRTRTSSLRELVVLGHAAVFVSPACGA
jgi:hypothetical protein